MMMTHAKCLWHKSRREGLVRDPFDRHGMPLKPLVLLASLSLTMTAAHWLNVYYIKKLHIYYSYTVFSIHSVAQLHIVYPFQVMSRGQENYVRNRSDHCLTITQKGENHEFVFFAEKEGQARSVWSYSDISIGQQSVDKHTDHRGQPEAQRKQHQ